jgi:hypothetical protein
MIRKRMAPMRYLFPVLLLVSALLPPAAAAKEPAAPEERLYIAKQHRYIAGGPTDDRDMGHSLCGTRCSGLSVDYLNYTEPGGWRLIKVASGQELTVPLNNPFMGGDCICIVDEYVLKIDELNRPADGRTHLPKIRPVKP